MKFRESNCPSQCLYPVYPSLPAPRCPSGGSLSAGRASKTEKRISQLSVAKKQTRIVWHTRFVHRREGGVLPLLYLISRSFGKTNCPSQCLYPRMPVPTRTAMPVRRQLVCRQGKRIGQTKKSPRNILRGEVLEGGPKCPEKDPVGPFQRRAGGSPGNPPTAIRFGGVLHIAYRLRCRPGEGPKRNDP